MKKIIIVAVAKNGVIGRKSGEMPWHVKEEFQHFKNTTMSFPIIMGRKTFISLGYSPLKGRLNIILSKNKDYKVKSSGDVMVLNSLKEAIKHCEDKNYEKAFIIGGGIVFEEGIELADEMIVSRMKFEAEGDVVFPLIKEALWEVKSIEEHKEFDIYTYVKRA
ncbi:MAG TPA: dihydrofolate reductase [Ignavibacteriaceae bacterium]|nr:dihydrofolate reductase [Ignavibacteriaceae bacterium]